MSPPRQSQAQNLELLREVSRSFYLTLRILPRPVRNQIGLAYLLARLSDTIADTEAVPPGERLETLRQVREAIRTGRGEKVPLAAMQAKGGSEAERILLARFDQLLGLLSSFEPADRSLIQEVITTIISGQELDLQRFAAASCSNILSLSTAAELDDYTFRVAGCVGDFWTRICLLHLHPKPKCEAESLAGDGIRFGKGLQLVNILRDLPADLRQGRCYLPATELAQAGLHPVDLLEARNESRLRPVYDPWLAAAEDHLRAGWKYVLQLPKTWWRVRLACAWPVLIGFRTIQKLRTENILDGSKRIKVSRPELKRILRSTVIALPFPSLWRELPARLSR